jgi:hypothetical protein
VGHTRPREQKALKHKQTLVSNSGSENLKFAFVTPLQSFFVKSQTCTCDAVTSTTPLQSFLVNLKLALATPLQVQSSAIIFCKTFTYDAVTSTVNLGNFVSFQTLLAFFSKNHFGMVGIFSFP